MTRNYLGTLFVVCTIRQTCSCRTDNFLVCVLAKQHKHFEISLGLANAELNSILMMQKVTFQLKGSQVNLLALHVETILRHVPAVVHDYETSCFVIKRSQVCQPQKRLKRIYLVAGFCYKRHQCLTHSWDFCRVKKHWVE